VRRRSVRAHAAHYVDRQRGAEGVHEPPQVCVDPRRLPPGVRESGSSWPAEAWQLVTNGHESERRRLHARPQRQDDVWLRGISQRLCRGTWRGVYHEIKGRRDCCAVDGVLLI
jgi:hypothetical protein